MCELRLRVLLIEDDEDDYILVRSLLSEVSATRFDLAWASTYESAINEICLNVYDVCLLDYRLGDRNGLELLQEAVSMGCRAPIILLTGQGGYDVDLEAMRVGAADYLVKSQINAPLLERSIRYAIERRKSEEALRESERQLRFLSAELLNVQESERKRIAAELHDNLGQILTAVKFGVENTLNHMKQGTASPQLLETLIPTIQYAIEEIRRIYTHLRPSLLDDLGIIVTIGWFCREFENVYTSIRIERAIKLTEEEVPESLKIVIYRVMQEALNNVAKHSNATRVKLSLRNSQEAVRLSIADNGYGFDIQEVLSADTPHRGLGLASMKERAELSGGNFRIESSTGSGTTIEASWPLSALA